MSEFHLRVVIDSVRSELVELFDQARRFDIRHFEDLSGQEVLEGLSGPTKALVVRTLELAGRLLRRADGRIETGTGQEASAHFGRDVDSLLVRTTRDNVVAELAFLVGAELRQHLARLEQHRARDDGWKMVCEAGSGLLRVQKSVAALETALCEVEGLPPQLRCDSELKVSLEVRRQYRKLWRLVAQQGELEAGEVRKALRSAGTLLAVMVGHPVYCHLHEVDRHHLRQMQGRIIAWMQQEAPETEAGVRLWQDFVAWAALLRRVNRRPELVAHDRAGLAAAAEALGREDDASLARAEAALESLGGFDDALDALVATRPPRALLRTAVERLAARAEPAGPSTPEASTECPPDPQGPLSSLARLAASGATGELIAAGSEAEVHVYLVSGRVAWATTSTERLAFRRYLLETLHVDEAALHSVFEDCQRTRRPLGETLVAWGLLERQQVREALRAQVVTALTSLQCLAGATTLFLPRGSSYTTYDPALTFDFDDVTGPQATPPPTASPSERAFADLRRRVPHASWVTLMEGREAKHSHGMTPPEGIPELALRLGQDLTLLAVRTATSCAVGGALPQPGQSLWCGLSPVAGFGAAVDLLSAPPRSTVAPEPGGASGPFRSFGGPSPGGELEHLRERLEHTPGAVGVVVLESTAPGAPWVLARTEEDAGRLRDEAPRHQAVLERDLFGTRSRGRSSLEQESSLQTALVADARWWWFGAELGSHTPASVWVALPLASSRELGWTLLASLARRLSARELRNGQ